MKAQHHLIFFILVLCGACLLFFSSELLLPEAIKKLVFRSPQIDTIGHFIGFFVLTWLVSSILKLSLLNTFYSLSFYSALSELGQYYLGFRNGEFSDFFADIAGISLYLVLKYIHSLYKSFTLKRIKKSTKAHKLMNIIIIGQGAMGLLWYHHLVQLTQKLPARFLFTVKLAEKNIESREKIQQYSFTDHKKHTYINSIDYAQTDDIKQANVVFLCVKSFQISAALQTVVKSLKNNSAIILAHNGMGTLTELPEQLKNKHNIYTLLTTHGCLRTAPFCITHTGIGSSDLGLLLGEQNDAQQQAITHLLNTALPSVHYHTNIQVKQWIKLAINCVINPLTAINNVSNGDINHASYQNTIIRLLEEIVAVAKAENVTLDFSELKQKVKAVAQATANNSSSMRCDVLANRRSEIDYINGYIHQLGIKHAVATPENTKMWQAVKKLLQ